MFKSSQKIKYAINITLFMIKLTKDNSVDDKKSIKPKCKNYNLTFKSKTHSTLKDNQLHNFVPIISRRLVLSSIKARYDQEAIIVPYEQ